MKNRIFSIALTVGMFTIGWFSPQPVLALSTTNPIGQIGISASLFNDQNQIIKNGSYDIRFTLYTTDRKTSDPYPSNTDARIWEETQKVDVKSGLIKAFLGSVTPFPATLNFQTGDYYVGIRIGTDSEMVPRKKLGSVPSAINTQYFQGKTIGINKGDIPVIASTGTLDVAILNKINQVGTIKKGAWQGTAIADSYIASALTGKTYNGINLITTTGNHTLTLSTEVTLDQNLSMISDVVFNTLSLVHALSPQNGGTGIVSYQTGDMLYATGETTLQILSLGANNQLLTIVNGVPTWKTINLGDELLGVLPFLNGGTGNTNFTLGSVIFSDGTKLTQDNANFFWDATTHRLGIGTTTPSQKLDIVGNVSISGTLFSDNLSLTTPLPVGSGGTGLSTSPSIGQFLIGNGTDYTLATLTQGTGITISNGAGVVTVTNAGVTSLTGTTDQIAVTANTGSIILSLPQSIASTSSPTFATLNTGQGNYELYAMNQDVLSTSTPTFASLTLTNPLTTGNGGTGITSYTAGDLLYYASGTTLSKLGIGAPGQVLVISGANIPTWVNSATATAHDLLSSSSHDDTTTASVQKGDLITGQGTNPTLWNRLALGTTGQVLISNGSDAYWGAVSGQTGIIQANSIDFSELKDVMTLDNNLTIDASLNNYSVNIDSNTLFVDTAQNRIGIGTTLPATALDLGGGVITTTGGTSTNWNTAYTNRADTWSYPLSLSGNTASLGYNTTNLKLTTNQLNTIQDIATTSAPTFATLNTGQGNYELYAMNQDVLSTSDPTFHAMTLTLALPVGSGGTGIASYTAGDMLYYVSGTTLTKLPISTNGKVLVIGGGIPAWTSLTYSDVGAEASLGFTPEDSANKVTSISGASTDVQYASAKLLYDQLAGKISTYGSQTAKYFLAAPNAGDGTPSFRAIVASDIPALSYAAPLSGTINEIAYFASASTIGSLAVATYPSLTELSYAKGVTSAIQTQLNSKQATLTNSAGLSTAIGGDVAVVDGGTGTSTGSITGTTALAFTAGGSNQNVTLTPSGTGYTILNGNVGIGTTSPLALLNIYGSTNAMRLSYDATNYSTLSANSTGELQIKGASVYDASLTIGSNDANSTAIIFDNLTNDFYVGIDNADSSKFKIGLPEQDAFMTILPNNGYIGIGTTSPAQMLQIGTSAAGGNVRIDNGWLCVDNNGTCTGAATAGTVYAVGAYTTGADYAEYFYTKDTDLKPGEAVCIDSETENGVKRCQNNGDNNIMGIVSSNPSIVGNKNHAGDEHYKIIGMLGQVSGQVSNENGTIKVGDSLTAGLVPGQMRKANAGESTVGVALQNFSDASGTIQILISRRNQSLTVEKVEQAVTDNITAMNIGDQVNALVSNAKTALDTQIANQSTVLTLQAQNIISLQNDITLLRSDGATEKSTLTLLQSQMDLIKTQNQSVIDFMLALNMDTLVYKDVLGNLDIGTGKFTAKDIEVKNITTDTLTMKENSTSGKGIILAGQTEVTIDTPDVSENAKISLTAKGSSNGKILYFDEIVAGTSFKVKIDAPTIEKDINFIWLIIQ